MPIWKNLLIVMVLALILPQTINGQDKGWRGFYNAAEKAVSNGQYHTAAKRYEKAAEIKPGNKEFAYNAGKYYLIARDYEKAVQFLAPLQTKTKQFPKVLYYYGMAEKARGNYNEALAALSVFSNDYEGSDKNQVLAFVGNEIKGCEIGRQQNGAINDSISITFLEGTINSQFDEVAPIPINEDLLYFSSNSSGNIGLFKSVRDSAGVWSSPQQPENLPLVRKSNFCHGSFSPDYTKFYFSVCEDFEGEWREDELKCSIYFSELVGNSWTEARSLGRFINLPGALNIQPYVTYEGKDEIVYFVSNRSGGSGGLDIWYIKKPIREGINSFGYPINAGEKINSPSNEMSPFYDINQATLFYSTDGKPGLGGFDVYAAVGSMDTWLDVYTMYAPINSSYDDLYYRPMEADKGFFVSNRPLEPLKFSTVDNDIFYFERKEMEEDSFMLNATMMDFKSGEALSLTEVEIFEVMGPDDFELYESLLLRSNELVVQLETGKEYLVITTKEGYEPVELLIDSEQVDGAIEIFLETEQELPAVDLEVPLVIDNPDDIEIIKDLPKDPIPELEFYPDATASKEEYRIQVAAVRNTSTFNTANLSSYGNVIIEEIENRDLSRILVGGFMKKADAERKLAMMKKESKEYSSAFIVRYTDGIRN